MGEFNIIRKDRTGECIRQSRIYYLITEHFRENPPDKYAFRIKELAEKFGCNTNYIYQVIRQYHMDSKRFLKYVPIPTEIQNEDNEWEYAVEQLHAQGFYFIQPLAFHKGSWGEPSFAQFEEYDTHYLKEAFNRALVRIRDAVDFGLKLDGIDVRKELSDLEGKMKMLTDAETKITP